LQIKQYTVVIIAVTALFATYFMGSTKFPQQKIIAEQQKAMTAESLMVAAEVNFTASQKEHFNHLKDDLSKATTDTSKTKIYEELIEFWGGDAKNDELAAFYYAEKAKLENSEKNLTFAANLILMNCLNDNTNSLKKGFKANLAKEMFEKALLKNPTNDSLNIGLGGSYMLGATTDNPMKGTLVLLEMVKKDSTNAYAQKMLGYGGLLTGQTEKAIERFIKSYTYNNKDQNLVIDIALLSKSIGKIEQANKWYAIGNKLFADNPSLLKEFQKEFQSSK
jgi:predicted Zn-dependent protease